MYAKIDLKKKFDDSVHFRLQKLEFVENTLNYVRHLL